jgi:hypothetical protein
MRRHGSNRPPEAHNFCGCCWRQITVEKDGVVARICACNDYENRCPFCARCQDHCCRTGWRRPEFPGKRGRRPGLER